MPRMAVALVLGLGSVLWCGPAAAEIFICAVDSIRVFADDALPGDPPLRIIQSPSLMECYGLALDNTHDEVWVGTGPQVSAFRATAHGTVSPLRTIGGSASGLGFPVGIAVDVEANELFVGTADGAIFVFPRDGVGDIPALRKIQGSATSGRNAAGLFVDRVHDELYVADHAGGEVLVFQRTADGDAPFARSFPLGGSPFGLVVDPRAGELFVARGGAQVDVLDLAGQPLRVIVGTATQLTGTRGLTLTDGHQILVASPGAETTDPQPVLGFPRHQHGDGAPIFRIDNGAPSGRSPWGLATTDALGCAEGHVASTCLFRDGFERGSTGGWAHAQP